MARVELNETTRYAKVEDTDDVYDDIPIVTAAEDAKKGCDDNKMYELIFKTLDTINKDRQQHKSLRGMYSMFHTGEGADQADKQFDSVPPLNIIKMGIKYGYRNAYNTSYKRDHGVSVIVSILKVCMKAIMSGAYLGFSITLAVSASSSENEWDKISAALLFPMGFVLIFLMGNDLATGNFALLPMAYFDGWLKRNQPNHNKKNNLCVLEILLNWVIVYGGNFVGSLIYMYILWGGMTHFNQKDEIYYEPFKESLCGLTEKKVLSYVSNGSAGWFAAMFNGILCNWMVCMGVLLSFSSKSTIGRVIAMYIPITLFITLGFEHSVVNLFLLPAGLQYGCDYTAAQWWLWNQIPVTIGNMIGGIGFDSLWYLYIWSHKL